VWRLTMAKARKAGITIRAKELLIEHNLTIALDDLCAKLKAEGFRVSPGSIQTLASDFRQSCRVLGSMGKLKNLTVVDTK
jgi:hypothetical protein